MRRIKILILLPGLRRCGPVLGAVALAKHLDVKQCDISVGCLKKYQTDYHTVIEDLKKHKIRVLIFGISGLIGMLKLNSVRDFIVRERVDIVNSYGLRPDIVNAIAAKRSISIASVRGMVRDEYRLKFGQIISGLFAFIHMQALTRMQCVIAMSDAMKDYLIKEGLAENKIACISNFVDLPDFHSIHTQKSRYNRHSCEAVTNIGYIGNFNPIKRIDWIIKGVSDLLKWHPDLSIMLHLIGDGPLWRPMQKLVSDLNLNGFVKFYGYIDNVNDALDELDLIVLASQFEGTPRVIMEAMSRGKTCIGSAIEGVKGLIIDNVTGYLFDPEFYDDFLRKLDFVIQENAFLDPVIIRKHIEDSFDAKTGATKILRLCNDLIRNCRS